MDVNNSLRVQQALVYFCEMFDIDLMLSLLTFKAIRLFPPSKHKIKPSASNLDCLCKFPFRSTSVIDGSKVRVA